MVRFLAAVDPSNSLRSEPIVSFCVGILGGGYMAFSTDHKRGVLGVPGTPYALLLGRSVDFDLYKAIFSLNAYNWRHIRIGISVRSARRIHTHWECDFPQLNPLSSS